MLIISIIRGLVFTSIICAFMYAAYGLQIDVVKFSLTAISISLGLFAGEVLESYVIKLFN